LPDIAKGLLLPHRGGFANLRCAPIKAKNSYFLDKIFRGVTLGGGVPEFMGITPEEVEAKREAVFKERMKKMPELFEGIKKELIMQFHQVEIVPVN
jgi:hypothetical protein